MNEAQLGRQLIARKDRKHLETSKKGSEVGRRVAGQQAEREKRMLPCRSIYSLRKIEPQPRLSTPQWQM